MEEYKKNNLTSQNDTTGNIDYKNNNILSDKIENNQGGWLPPLNTVKSFNNKTIKQNKTTQCTKQNIINEQHVHENINDSCTTYFHSGNYVSPSAVSSEEHSSQCMNTTSPYGIPQSKTVPCYVSPIYTSNKRYLSPVMQESRVSSVDNQACFSNKRTENTYINTHETVDLTQPLSVLCSRMLTEHENEKLQKYVGIYSKNPIIRIGLLIGAFSILNFSIAVHNENLNIVVPLLILVVVLLVYGLIINHLVCKRNSKKKYCLWQKRGVYEKVIELYQDRLIVMSKQFQLTIMYSSIQKIIEMTEMLILVDELGNCITFRASDLIPFDAQNIKKIIYSRAKFAKYKRKGTLCAMLAKPLDIPIIQTKKDIIQKFSIDQKNIRLNYFSSIKKCFLFRLPLYLSYCLVIGIGFANTFWITDKLWIDILIYFSICLVAMLILLGVTFSIKIKILHRKRSRYNFPCGIAFTRQDMAICIGGITTVYPWNQVESNCKKDGFVLKLKYDKQRIPLFNIPWKAISNREEFIKLLRELSG